MPLLCLHGVSSGDFVPALEQFLGSSSGLSAATVTRLTAQWQADLKAFGERDLSATDYVYVWADGIHLRIRGGRRPGDHGCSGGRHQGADRHGGRLPRIVPVLGGLAAGLPAARDVCSRPGRR